jgi:hypothetical protein
VSPLTSHFRSALICGHCSRHVGDLGWDGERPTTTLVLRTTGEAPRSVLLGQRTRCPRCGGPAFAEAPERVREPAPPVLGRAGVNRKRLPQAS